MIDRQTLLQRVTDWFHGADWPSSEGGFDPDETRRAEADQAEFLRRKEYVRTRLDRLQAIVDVKTGRITDDE